MRKKLRIPQNSLKGLLGVGSEISKIKDPIKKCEVVGLSSEHNARAFILLFIVCLFGSPGTT